MLNHHSQDDVEEASQSDFCAQEWAGHPVGVILRAYRDFYGRTVEDAAADLCIRRDHLCALEEGELEVLPKGGFGEGFVLAYAKYLGLPTHHMVTLYRHERALRPAQSSTVSSPDLLRGVATVSYSPRWPSFAVLTIAALLLGSSYFVMAAYTATTSPDRPTLGNMDSQIQQDLVLKTVVLVSDDEISAFSQSSGSEEAIRGLDRGEDVRGESLSHEWTATGFDSPVNATVNLSARRDQVTVYGVSVPLARPDRNDLEPLPLEAIDQEHRVIVSALGLAYITLVNDRTDQAILRAEYQRGDQYKVPDGQRMRLMTEHLDQIELILDGVSYRIPRAVAALNEPLVLDPDALPFSNEVYRVEDQDI